VNYEIIPLRTFASLTSATLLDFRIRIDGYFSDVVLGPANYGTGIRDQKTVPDTGPDPLIDAPLVLMR
jgi:hypothetical protein